MAMNPKILIIDDDEAMLDSCTQVFKREGYQTLTAENGSAGIRKFKKSAPDLVLVDLKMPGIDGLEVLKRLKSQDPDCMAIMITGYGTIGSAVEAIKLGAYDFLPKPFSPDEIRHIVKRGLEWRRSLQETEQLRTEKEIMRKFFVSMVSHELRSPLASIQQTLIAITGGVAGKIPDKPQQLLLQMKNRVKGLLDMIGDWLDLSRIESGEMITDKEPFDFGIMLSDVIGLLQPLAEECKVDLCCDIPDEIPPITGSRETLQMLFVNLIHNALKYNKEGGSVHILVKVKTDGFEIHVRDTGIGIPEDQLPMIFEKFYRTRGRCNIVGTGLGLAIVKKVVELHNGHIHVQSQEGEGTEFTVRIPRKSD
jgi:signal transduction histidine kinase